MQRPAVGLLVDPPGGPAPVVTLSTQSLDFASQDLTTTSAIKSVLIANSGTAALTFSSTPSVAGSAFSSTTTCGADLAPGASCVASVAFSPLVAGAAAGSLTFGTNASPASNSVSLTGTGVLRAALARWGSTTLDFSGVMVGSTSTRPVTLTNDGNTTAHWSALTGVTAGVTADMTSCASVAAGASCTVQFTYSPASTAAYSAAAIAPVSDAHSNTLTLTGQGLLTKVDISTGSLTFAAQGVTTTSAVQTVAVLNTGNTSVSIGALSVSAPFAATTDCASTLASGSTCHVNVTVTPVAAGAALGTLTLGTGAGAQTVSLSGSGTNPTATLTAVSGSSFGAVYLGGTASKTFTYANPGPTSVSNISAVVSGTDISMTANTCGTAGSTVTLVSGATCSVTVRYAPLSAGTLASAALTVSSNAQGSPSNQSLTGSASVLTLTSFKLTGQEWVSLGATALDYPTTSSTCAVNINGLTGWRVPSSTEALAMATTKTASGLAALSWSTGYYWTSTLASAGVQRTFNSAAASSTGASTVSLSNGACVRDYAYGTLSASAGVDFGAVYSGHVATKTFTFTASAAPLTGVAAAVTGTGISLTSNTCGTAGSPVTLAAAASCAMTVQYAPTGVATLATLTGASVSVASNAENTPATLALAGSAMPVDPYYAQVSYLLHMDGVNNGTTFTEEKGTAVTNYGTIATSTAQKLFGTSSMTGPAGTFSGIGLGTFQPAGDFTIEGWIFPTSSTAFGIMVDVGGITNNNYQSQAIYVNQTAGQLTWVASSSVPNGVDISSPNGCATPCGGAISIGSYVLNAWNHYAVVRSGAQYFMYLNGARTATVNKNLAPYASAYKVILGTYPSTTQNNMVYATLPAYMDEIRFTNGVARYTGATYTVPTAAFPNSQ